MNKILKYLLLIPLFCVGCSESQQSEERAKVEVSIFGSSSTNSSTKTFIEDDNATTTWAPGDQIAVWAKASDDASYALAAEKFTMRYYGTSLTQAEFSATISEMDEGTYSYYGVYPYPVSVNGTQANFTLSAIQSGAYDGVNDIMVATPASSRELSGTTYNTLASMSFNHMMHILRIEVPTGRDNFGEPLTGLEITFPQNVVGDIAVDAEDSSRAPVLSNGSNVVTLEFDEPFETGDDNYMWLFVNPTTLSGTMTFVGFGADGLMSNSIEASISKTLQSGHVTPVTLTVPTPKLLTTLSVTISADDVKSRIGEPLESVTFTLPSGVTFDDGTSSVTMAAQSDSDEYNLYLYNVDDFGTSFTSGSLTVRLDTDRVYKTETIALSTANVNSSTEYTIDVPYFFKTDFSDITATDSASTTGESHTSDIDGTGDLSGWEASTRATWTKGSHITVRPYYFTVFGYQTLYTSKVSSCELSNWGLKSTASNVSLYVSFTAKWTYSYHGSVTVTFGGTDGGSINDGMYSSGTNGIDITSAGTATVTNQEISGLSSTSRIGWLGSGTFGKSNYSTTKYDTIDIDDVTITLVAE
ncbi:MAG: hypothetical protein SNI18_03425 [Rikenellaceae bacterium]